VSTHHIRAAAAAVHALGAVEIRWAAEESASAERLLGSCRAPAVTHTGLLDGVLTELGAAEPTRREGGTDQSLIGHALGCGLQSVELPQSQ
jgi:hypothetical protein